MLFLVALNTYIDFSVLMKDLGITEDVARKWICVFHATFPTFKASVTATFDSYVSLNTLPSLPRVSVNTVLNSKHFDVSEWNQLISNVKHYLVLLYCAESNNYIHTFF
jgi:hypothetical protein